MIAAASITPAAVASRVREYYAETDRFYQFWAGTDTEYSLHYGYFDENVRTHAEALLNMNRMMADMAAIRPGERVLDAGCGVGASSLWLARNRGVEAVGITLSDVQLEKARGFAAEAGLSDRVSFESRCYLDTGFPDASFDVVWALESMCYAPDKAEFVREATRLLRPGGRLIVADGFATEGPHMPFDRMFLERWMEGWVVPNLATPRKFEAALRANGLSQIQFRNITENVMPSAVRILQSGLLAWPYCKLRGKSPSKMKHLSACIYQYLVVRRDTALYGAFSATRS